MEFPLLVVFTLKFCYLSDTAKIGVAHLDGFFSFAGFGLNFSILELFHSHDTRAKQSCLNFLPPPFLPSRSSRSTHEHTLVLITEQATLPLWAHNLLGFVVLKQKHVDCSKKCFNNKKVIGTLKEVINYSKTTTTTTHIGRGGGQLN